MLQKTTPAANSHIKIKTSKRLKNLILKLLQRQESKGNNFYNTTNNSMIADNKFFLIRRKARWRTWVRHLPQIWQIIWRQQVNLQREHCLVVLNHKISHWEKPNQLRVRYSWQKFKTSLRTVLIHPWASKNNSQLLEIIKIKWNWWRRVYTILNLHLETIMRPRGSQLILKTAIAI